MHSHRPTQRRSGLTMVELMITLVIGAILLALAVPQMREYIVRKRVSGAATELAGDVRLARAMMLQQNQPIWVNFGSNDEFTCYVILTEGNGSVTDQCSCTAVPMCPAVFGAPTLLRSVFIQRNTGVTLTSNSTYVIYNAAVGAPTLYDGTAQAVVDSSAGGRVRVSMGGLTRASVCSLVGHTAEFGDCP